MAEYEYGRIKVLAEKLVKAEVGPDIIAEIMRDGEKITKTAKPEKKAEWLLSAMRRMDDLLENQVRQSVRESCACCLGGKRLELSKAIAKNFTTLDERLEEANRTSMVFGHGVTREGDAYVVRFDQDGRESYGCVCLPRAKEPASPTYCFCCGGHIKHHLQIALGLKLQCHVRHTALTSGGTKPCVLEYREAPADVKK